MEPYTGLYIGHVWAIHGPTCGPYMDATHGPYMVLHGPCAEHVWIYGPCMDPYMARPCRAFALAHIWACILIPIDRLGRDHPLGKGFSTQAGSSIRGRDPSFGKGEGSRFG